jgi:ADP-ribose pyrophosphatase YjhB (NUDIX family)
MALHDHCSSCGAAYAPGQPWPRVCAACTQITYRNPLPVAVCLVPVGDGLLLVRRAIAPVGKLALPGGFIDHDETWQEAMAREVLEETGVDLDPASLREHAVRSSSAGHLLVFGLAPTLSAGRLPPFTPSPEVSERLVVTAPPLDIAFPFHDELIRAYFADGRRVGTIPPWRH